MPETTKMGPFSLLKRSPRGRRGNEQETHQQGQQSQQASRDDVKSPIGTTGTTGTMLREDVGRDGTGDIETAKARRGGFSSDLLQNLRNRLTGKRAPSQTRPEQQQQQWKGKGKQELPLEAPAAVSYPLVTHVPSRPSFLNPRFRIPYFTYPFATTGAWLLLRTPILLHALQQSALEIAWMQLQHRW